jgi:hypothetical protein
MYFANYSKAHSQTIYVGLVNPFKLYLGNEGLIRRSMRFCCDNGGVECAMI